jgi:hypothetical protein
MNRGDRREPIYHDDLDRRRKLCGHLFSGRYKALVVNGSARGYLKTVCDYVRLKPGGRRRICGCDASPTG